MATKPKIPPPAVPVIGPDGLMNLDWYKFLSQLAHVGEFSTTVGAAGAGAALPATPTGYMTQVINSTAYLVPFYAQP